MPGKSVVQLLPITNEIAKAGETLRDEVNAAIESPANLLPPDVLERVEALKQLSESWKSFLGGAKVQEVKNDLLKGLGVTDALQKLAALKTTLEKTLNNDPRYRALSTQVEQLQAAFAALEQTAQQAPLTFLGTLLEKLNPLLDGLDNFAGWSSWLSEDGQAVQVLLTEVAEQVLKGVIPSTLVEEAQSLKNQADYFKQDLANKGSVADQAILQVSEITLAAIAHAEAVKATVERYHAEAIVDVKRRILTELFTDALRFSQESLGKVSRLLELERNLTRIKLTVGTNFQTAYLDWGLCRDKGKIRTFVLQQHDFT